MMTIRLFVMARLANIENYIEVPAEDLCTPNADDYKMQAICAKIWVLEQNDHDFMTAWLTYDEEQSESEDRTSPHVLFLVGLMGSGLSSLVLAKSCWNLGGWRRKNHHSWWNFMVEEKEPWISSILKIGSISDGESEGRKKRITIRVGT